MVCCVVRPHGGDIQLVATRSWTYFQVLCSVDLVFSRSTFYWLQNVAFVCKYNNSPVAQENRVRSMAFKNESMFVFNKVTTGFNNDGIRKRKMLIYNVMAGWSRKHQSCIFVTAAHCTLQEGMAQRKFSSSEVLCCRAKLHLYFMCFPFSQWCIAIAY